MRTAVLIVLTCLGGGTARATIMVQMDLPQLVGRADVIFVGKVIRTNSHWSEDRRHIVTDSTLEVERPIRGTRARETVVVRSLGGVVNGLGMKVSGSPSFKSGDQVLLFTDDRGGHRYVTGMRQGVFPVLRDRAGALMVRHLPGEMTLARRTAGGGLRPVSARPFPPQPLDSFVRTIEETISRCARESDRCQSR